MTHTHKFKTKLQNIRTFIILQSLQNINKTVFSTDNDFFIFSYFL